MPRVACLLWLACAAAMGQSIRDIDFKNYTCLSNGGAPDDAWFRLGIPRRLVEGTWLQAPRDDPNAGLTLESIEYADFTDDGLDDARVVVRYDTGGTGYSYWLYSFTYGSGAARLIGFYHSGSRAYLGLKEAHVRDGVVILELFDPEGQQGLCCSSRMIRRRYRWNGVRFVQTGPVHREPTETVTRREVNIFGMPVDIILRDLTRPGAAR